MSDYDQWLENLKEGDKVFLCNRNGNRMATVFRITKTQIIAAIKTSDHEYRYKFKRSSGSEISTDRWNRYHLLEITPERKNEFIKDNKRNKVKFLLTQVVIPNDIDELNKMSEFLTQYIKKEEQNG